jgi:8-amino-7-oxononanoate synthase
MSGTWIDDFDAGLGALDAAHLRRRRRVVEPGDGGARMVVDGCPMVGFCSNDYLGLARHPAIVEAVREAATRCGAGAGASPLVSGHSASNDALERELAAFVGLPRALYFYAGYAANIGIVPALVGAGDAVFSDALNHACLIDGARLSRATIHRFAHADLGALESALQASAARRKLVITDAVFSMDGDVADLPALLSLAERHDALLLLDDAHGFGVRGPRGRGSLAAAGLTGACASRRVLYMATLGKAAGVAGAFVAGHERLVEWLLQKTRSYLFATAAPAMLAEALRASLRVIEADEGRRELLGRHIARLRGGLAGCRWPLVESHTPIQPLMVGDNAEAIGLMDRLAERGLWVPAIRPPTVPEGTARLRIALSSSHSEADVDQLVQALQHFSLPSSGRGAMPGGASLAGC